MRMCLLLMCIWLVNTNGNAQNSDYGRKVLLSPNNWPTVFIPAISPAISDKNINALKRDTAFIYAEVTMNNLNEAKKGAYALFDIKIAEWAKIKYAESCLGECIEKARRCRHEMETQRGRDYYRVFVYVNKKDIVVECSQETVLKDYRYVLNEEELEMITIDIFYKVEPYIKKLRNSEKLEGYGKYKTMPKDEPCYLFIYNKEGDIVAVLKKSNDNTINLKTREQDIINNYKNCGAIWFQLK